jgi:hypothetical protein
VLLRKALHKQVSMEQAEHILIEACVLHHPWRVSSPRETMLTTTWEQIKVHLQPGDEVWMFEAGDSGLALVRLRKAIALIYTHFERRRIYAHP